MAETAGEKLKKQRLNKGLTLEQAEAATHIRIYYLKALEEDDYLSLPSMVQGRGFLRSYAVFLGLDPAELIPPVETKLPQIPSSPAETKPSPEKKPKSATPKPQPKPVEENPSAPASIAAPDTERTNSSTFIEIGQQLKERREMLGLSLAEVERYTHIKAHYLEILESGQVNALPSTVQGRGMLNNYARFLNLDAEALLLRYADGLQQRRKEKLTAEPQHHAATQVSEKRLALRHFISFDLAVGGILIVLLVGFVVWGTAQVVDIQKTQVNQATLPPVSQVLLGTAVPSEILATSTATSSAVPTQQAGFSGTLEFTALPSGSAPIQIYIISRQTAWIKIISDGKTAYEGRMIQGGAYSYAGSNQVEVITGNAAAFQIYYNETDLGNLGTLAEVIDLIFTTNGEITPTPTITPTATQTSRYSATPTVQLTGTVSLSGTPQLTGTGSGITQTLTSTKPSVATPSATPTP